MFYRPDDIMAFGINKGYSLKTIYQFKPTYITWLIKNVEEFKINPEDFKHLPNPTIPDPKPIKSIDSKLELEPKIKFASSVANVIQYIESNGKIKELKFNFSDETLKILRNKELGVFVKPKHTKSI